MNLPTKLATYISGKKAVAAQLFILLLLVVPINFQAQESEIFTITADAIQDGKRIELAKAGWKYQSGDREEWANPQFDDSTWEKLEETTIKPDAPPPSGWNGRAWFRLRLKIDETAANRTFALIGWQTGAAEVYLDGRLLTRFGEITEAGETPYNPSNLPIPFKFEGTGEHLLAVRYSQTALKDVTSGTGAWLARGGVRAGFTFGLADASDVRAKIQNYANTSSMRVGYLFIGILSALALLHFLLFIFYRAERANLFYSIYALAWASNLLCGNYLAFGHQGLMANIVLSILASALSAVSFIALLAFLHVAFGRRFGIMFWTIAGIWTLGIGVTAVFLNNSGWLRAIPGIGIFLTFSYSISLLVEALKKRQPGARILMGGVQLLSFGMLYLLLSQLRVFTLPEGYGFIGELAEFVLLLAVPVAVSVFLARNFARTNRDLLTQLAQVKELSEQKVEQERQAVELRAENERRAKELEEARQLQLSMLPKKLPQLSNIEIAAYMRPATEVGGDYYDFHVGTDGTLTVAVGDATGHGLKAGTVVTATKGLFNNLAHAPDIPDTFRQISRSLKAMNLRGLFMAMTMLKFKDNRLVVCAAGMPSALIYRHATGRVEEAELRALPLGSVSNFVYQEQEYALSANDCVVVMSDGFPEMFNEAGEMQANETAKNLLAETARLSAQEIINRFVEVGEEWAGGRSPDDDVTFVVVKVTDGDGQN